MACAIELVLGKCVPLLLSVPSEEELDYHSNLNMSTIVLQGKVIVSLVVVCEDANILIKEYRGCSIGGSMATDFLPSNRLKNCDPGHRKSLACAWGADDGQEIGWDSG